jgi:hypothetical protein
MALGLLNLLIPLVVRFVSFGSSLKFTKLFFGDSFTALHPAVKMGLTPINMRLNVIQLFDQKMVKM